MDGGGAHAGDPATAVAAARSRGRATRSVPACRSCVISYLRYRGRHGSDYKGRIGNLIRDARKHRGLTQHQLAELLATSQSAINRIEKGHQNLSLEMLARIGAALDSEIVALGAGPTHLRVDGPTTLSGSIDVKTSKNAGVALLCASLLNRGRTTLRKVARIEEVNRLLEVLNSLGVAHPLAQRRQRPRDHPAGGARPRPRSTRRPRAVPAR